MGKLQRITFLRLILKYKNKINSFKMGKWFCIHRVNTFHKNFNLSSSDYLIYESNLNASMLCYYSKICTLEFNSSEIFTNQIEKLSSSNPNLSSFKSTNCNYIFLDYYDKGSRKLSREKLTIKKHAFTGSK